MKEIKNKTIYSNENIKEFLNVYYFEKIKTIRIILNVFILIIIITFFTTREKNTIDIITLIFSLFGLIEINTTMIPKLNYYKLTKKKDGIINTKVNYIFKANNFKLNKDEFIEYSSLNKVIETPNAYYLYINNSRALIVDKQTLNEEEISNLTNIFKEKVSTYKYKK